MFSSTAVAALLVQNFLFGYVYYADLYFIPLYFQTVRHSAIHLFRIIRILHHKILTIWRGDMGLVHLLDSVSVPLPLSGVRL